MSCLSLLPSWMLEWVAIPFSRGFSRPGNRTQASCIGGRFFTIWTTREAIWVPKLAEEWSGADRRDEGNSSASCSGYVLLFKLLRYSEDETSCDDNWKTKKVKVLVVQSSPTLGNPMNCSPPGFSVHESLRARILKWAAIPFSRGSAWPRDQTRVSCIAGGFFTIWGIRKAQRWK